ncbi:MAG: stage 0 sporulation family protein [Clostridia bacterium]|nr:stage 0 sporulation family protein [Clostridia bacterium]
MATVIGVRFKKAGKVYYFDPCDFWPKPGQNVIVETARGIEFGEVVTGARSVSDQQIVAPLKKVVRIATEEDEQRAAFNAKREEEAFRVCQEKVAKHKLEMKLVSVEYTFDNSKIIFYFTANGRVDFRELVKDLASVFKMRIELRQIGVRDEAKMLGGLGSCGRPICCGAFLGDFQPVSIKMAKEQNLSLNPTKISGQCGRLMCCLKYEQDTYEQTLKRVPRVGKDIVTPDGVGVITEINAIRETVKVRIRTGEDDSFEVREYSMDDVRKPGPNDAPAVREAPKAQEKRNQPKKTPIPQQTEEEKPEEEENKRKRYPHQKAPKNLSTDQFLEKMKEHDDTEAEPSGENAKAEQPKEHKSRRRRGGRGHHRGEGQKEGAGEAGNGAQDASRAAKKQPEKAPEN